MKEKLKIVKGDHAYYLDFTNTHEAEKVTHLFGCAQLETAFPLTADPDKVRAHIQSLNPSYEVVLA